MSGTDARELRDEHRNSGGIYNLPPRTFTTGQTVPFQFEPANGQT